MNKYKCFQLFVGICMLMISISGCANQQENKENTSQEVIEEKENGYFQISIADYTTLSADYNSEGELMVICLKRQQYSLR